MGEQAHPDGREVGMGRAGRRVRDTLAVMERQVEHGNTVRLLHRIRIDADRPGRKIVRLDRIDLERQES